MSKVHAIRRQIKSVKNINQITKAMEMVAASKLRRAQEATFRSRLYATAARELLSQLRQVTSAAAHPLFSRRGGGAGRLLIVFTSDRGLAGAYNSNILKALLPLLPARPAGGPAKIIVIGHKGAQFLSRLSADSVEILGAYPTWSAEQAARELGPVVTTALSLYEAGQVDEVSVLFTDYISTVRQQVTQRVVLPIDSTFALQQAQSALRESKGAKATVDKPADNSTGLFEPSPAEVLNYVVPRFLEVQLYQAHLEALASEHSMRMMAMKNASDNAEEITDDLTLTYNGARQAAITQELAEISAGADAIS